MHIFLVGGAVRDELLQLPVKEKDYVVVGATPEELLRLGFKRVGKEFPVFLHPKTREEYALARFEKKIGKGYKGFKVDVNPNISLQEDLSRRDFTINAMAKDASGQLIDPFGGKEDLEKKLLRHVSPAFSEDPVRILRAARFLARYHSLGFSIAKETLLLMRNMVDQGEVHALTPERVFKEFSRALQEKNPHVFFQTLELCHALTILFPEISMTGEGILALELSPEFSEKPCVRFAALCHHFPENQTDWTIGKRITTLKQFSTRLRLPREYSDLIRMTIAHHTTLLENTFSNEFLLTFFIRLDAYRRHTLFLNFIEVCRILAKLKNKNLDFDYLLKAYYCVREVRLDTAEIQTLKANEIPKVMHQKRVDRLMKKDG